MSYRVIRNLSILAIMRHATEITLEDLRDTETGKLYLFRCPGDQMPWAALIEDAFASPPAGAPEKDTGRGSPAWPGAAREGP